MTRSPGAGIRCASGRGPARHPDGSGWPRRPRRRPVRRPRARRRTRGRCRAARPRGTGPSTRLARSQAARWAARATTSAWVSRRSPATRPETGGRPPARGRPGRSSRPAGRRRRHRGPRPAAPQLGSLHLQTSLTWDGRPIIETRCTLDRPVLPSLWSASGNGPRPPYERTRPLEFGIFNAACLLPKYRAAHGEAAEHDRIMDEVAFIVAADQAGFKYTWASEHHFLTDYSHLSASESFLAFCAAKTNYIHIGSGIFNITPPVNHPGPDRRAGGHARPPLRGSLRVRHRPRLVHDRAEGLRHPRARHHPRNGGRDAAPDRAHVEGRGVQLRRQVLLHAPAQRAAQALLQAPPGHLDGGRQPVDLRPGGRAGRRRALLRLLHSRPAHPAGGPLQGEDRATAPTRSVASSTTTS